MTCRSGSVERTVGVTRKAADIVAARPSVMWTDQCLWIHHL